MGAFSYFLNKKTAYNLKNYHSDSNIIGRIYLTLTPSTLRAKTGGSEHRLCYSGTICNNHYCINYGPLIDGCVETWKRAVKGL